MAYTEIWKVMKNSLTAERYPSIRHKKEDTP